MQVEVKFKRQYLVDVVKPLVRPCQVRLDVEDGGFKLSKRANMHVAQVLELEIRDLHFVRDDGLFLTLNLIPNHLALRDYPLTVILPRGKSDLVLIDDDVPLPQKFSYVFTAVAAALRTYCFIIALLKHYLKQPTLF